MSLFKGFFKKDNQIFVNTGSNTEQLMNTGPTILGKFRSDDLGTANNTTINADIEGLSPGRWLICLNFTHYLSQAQTTGTAVYYLYLNGDLIYVQNFDKFNWGPTDLADTRSYSLAIPIEITASNSKLEFATFGSGNGAGKIRAFSSTALTLNTPVEAIKAVRIG